MKRTHTILPLLLAACLLLSATGMFAKGLEDQIEIIAKSNAIQQSANATNRTLVNVGQIAMWIFADGQSALNPGGQSGLFFPRGSNPPTATIFQDGLVWGGNVQDGAEPALRVGGTMYAVGHAAGRITSQGVAENRNDATVDRIWRVRRDFVTADLKLDAAEFNSIQTSAVSDAQIQQVRDIYHQDWIDWPAEKGAPFYDANSDGVYTPEFNANGTPKLFPGADEPGVADADQVVWLVSNDINDAITKGFAGSPPIGLEQQITLWAYARSDALGQIIFKQFRLIYKGTQITPPTAVVENMYMCQWSDPDVGSSGDDLAGCDTTLSLGFAYNSGATDATFSSVGLPPPASGYDFFAGPLVEDASAEAIFGLKKRAGFRNLPMTTFASFSAGSQAADPGTIGSYDVTLQWYNLLRGFLPRPQDVVNPSPFVDPTQNNAPTKFTLYGNPVTNSGWVDTGSGDRRILLSSGPFTLAFGDTQETVVATLSALGTDRLSSVALLKFVDRFAQEAFDNLFELPKPPATPVLTASELNGQIFLNWAGNSDAVSETEGLDDKGFVFEGYNVYQLPTSGATIDQSARIATFDVVNDFTTIAQETFDISSGLVLSLPVQFGNNTGIERTLTVSTDVVRGLNLINGQTYYFGVSAYSNNPDPDATVKTLESTLAIVTVVPQTVKPGVRFNATIGQAVEEVAHVNILGGGLSDGSVTPIIVDPSKVTGDAYKVIFKEVDDVIKWDLINITTNGVVLADQTNQLGDENYLIVDGLQVKVAGPPADFKRLVVIANANGPIDAEALASFEITPAPGYNALSVDWYRDVALSTNGGALGVNTPSQANGGALFIVAGGPTIATHTAAVGRWFRAGANDAVIIPNDYEIRFTYEADNMGVWSSNFGNVAPGTYPVPFELWYLGSSTLDDPSDDVRMIPVILDDNDGTASDTEWDFKLDHEASGGTNDPYSDWIYFYMPADDSPGEAGYQAAIAAAPTNVDAAWHEHIARLIIMNWNLTQGGGGTNEPVEQGTVFRIETNKINSVNDEFTFSTAEYAPTTSTNLAKKDVADLVNAFPNPYYGVNRFEENRFNRRITFSHLPERAIIRIFNLAGILVRKLEKDDASQFINWNLQNENSLPIASGIYIANIEMPDLGVSKNLKIAIVKEQEFLRRF